MTVNRALLIFVAIFVANMLINLLISEPLLHLSRGVFIAGVGLLVWAFASKEGRHTA